MSQRVDRQHADRLRAALRQRIADGERLTSTPSTQQTLAIMRAHLQILESHMNRSPIARLRQFVQWAWSCWPSLPPETDDDWIERQW